MNVNNVECNITVSSPGLSPGDNGRLTQPVLLFFCSEVRADAVGKVPSTSR